MKRKVAAGALALMLTVGLAALSHTALAQKRLGSGQEGFGPQGVVQEVASILGLSVDQVMEEKIKGKSLEELALGFGLTPEDLAARIIEARQTRMFCAENVERALRRKADEGCIEGGCRLFLRQGQGKHGGVCRITQ